MNIRFSSNINVYILCRLCISIHPKHEMATFDTRITVLYMMHIKVCRCVIYELFASDLGTFGTVF